MGADAADQLKQQVSQPLLAALLLLLVLLLLLLLLLQMRVRIGDM